MSYQGFYRQADSSMLHRAEWREDGSQPVRTQCGRLGLSLMNYIERPSLSEFRLCKKCWPEGAIREAKP